MTKVIEFLDAPEERNKLANLLVTVGIAVGVVATVLLSVAALMS